MPPRAHTAIHGVGVAAVGWPKGAAGLSEAAAIAEGAAPQIADQRGHHARDHAERLAGPGTARDRDAADEAACIGMARVAKERVRGRRLDDLAGVHHGDTVRDARHDAEIVGDEDEGDAELALKIGEEAQNLRLDGHVERRRRLVGDEEVGVAHERHRDHHALAEPARKLMRVLPQALTG